MAYADLNKEPIQHDVGFLSHMYDQWLSKRVIDHYTFVFASNASDQLIDTSSITRVFLFGESINRDYNRTTSRDVCICINVIKNLCVGHFTGILRFFFQLTFEWYMRLEL